MAKTAEKRNGNGGVKKVEINCSNCGKFDMNGCRSYADPSTMRRIGNGECIAFIDRHIAR